MRTFSALLGGAALFAAAVPALAAGSWDNSKAEARLAKALAGRVAGKPVDCIQLRNIESSEVIDGTAIVYRTGGGRLYVNRPEIGATSLDRDDILVTRSYGSQLCSIDIVGLVDRNSGFENGFVGLGPFVPYEKMPAAD